LKHKTETMPVSHICKQIQINAWPYLHIAHCFIKQNGVEMGGLKDVW